MGLHCSLVIDVAFRLDFGMHEIARIPDDSTLTVSILLPLVAFT